MVWLNFQVTQFSSTSTCQFGGRSQLLFERQLHRRHASVHEVRVHGSTINATINALMPCADKQRLSVRKAHHWREPAHPQQLRQDLKQREEPLCLHPAHHQHLADLEQFEVCDAVT